MARAACSVRCVRYERADPFANHIIRARLKCGAVRLINMGPVELALPVLAAIVLVTLAVGAVLGRALAPKPRVNTTVDLKNPKVVHKCPIPDVSFQTVATAASALRT
jgi:hypothetical protein